MKTHLQIIKACFILLLFIVLLFINACKVKETDKSLQEFQTFLVEHEKQVAPIQKEYNLASFKASTSGSEADFKNLATLEIALTKVYANKENFAKLKAFKESKQITDELLQRQLDVLYNTFLPYQIEENKLIEIVMLELEIQQKYTNYRPLINEKEITDNEIDNVLLKSKNSEELEKYWRASKKVGREISEDLIQLVKKRNIAAKELGFTDYYEMMMVTSGQNPAEIDKIFDELDIMTRGPYTQLKQEIDEYLYKYYSISKADLMPWHYQNRFFQEAPKIYNVNFDSFYKEVAIVGTISQFFSNIGLDVSDILENSDFEERSGKTQSAQVIGIEPNSDVRIIANLTNDASSANTLLYETGFASTYKSIDPDLPYVLRKPAHFMISDAIGTLFSRLTEDPAWLKTEIHVSDSDVEKVKKISAQQLRLNKFVFSRWAQVMYRFEKAMYANPDQDLNKLWWDLVQNYQMMNMPADRNEPDWASKTHFITLPCTYHNYMLGELFASQICFYLRSEIMKSDGKLEFSNNKEIGNYIKEQIIKPGSRYNWSDLIKQATKQELSPDHFANQYIQL